jgi:signal peptidase II
MPHVPAQRFVLFTALALIGFAADLVTKSWAFGLSELRAGETLWIWTGHVGVQLSRNWGAVFGIGQDLYWLFAALSVLAAVGVPVWLFRFRAASDLWLTVAMGLVMGGVLGNLYDRLGLSGETWKAPSETRDATHAVRDWILWQLNDEQRWPNFNIADSLLVTGAFILFVRILFEPRGMEAGPSERTRVPPTQSASDSH